MSKVGNLTDDPMSQGNGSVAILDEEAPAPGVARYSARRTRLQVLLWRGALRTASLTGPVLRKAVVDFRGPLVALTIAGGALLASRNHWAEAAICFVFATGLVAAAAALSARKRLLVGDFRGLLRSDESSKSGPEVDLANLLQVELSRLSNLFRVVEDQRAVWSGLGPGRALDATLSVDDLISSLQGAVNAETKVQIGPVSVPVAPLMTLAGRAVRARRVSGNLHRDGNTLILTAQQRGRGGLSWRVSTRMSVTDADSSEAGADEVESAGGAASLSAMVSELALRIFTDVALGRDVRWQATDNFVQGLRKFRACLRTPQDRKVNLKDAEELFLDALAEDEDFPLGYYNLGVVYTELHGLAVVAGRLQEAEMYLSAAEVSFGRAIDKHHTRWETYQAFAQTQFQHKRYETVIELCERICQLHPPPNQLARAHELWARALISANRTDDDRRKAIREARLATHLAIRALLSARLVRKASPGDDDDRVPRCEELVGACARTFATCYSMQVPARGDAPAMGILGRYARWREEAIVRRATALFKFAERFLASTADLHFEFGLRALNRGHLPLAEAELQAAVQSDPTRPTYAGAFALARARNARTKGDLSASEREEIRGRCSRALRDMAGAFFPLRDAEACELLARVHDELADDSMEGSPAIVARQLRSIAAAVEARLNEAVSGASVSAFFLEALEEVDPPWQEALSDYGTAIRDARSQLIGGQSQLPGGATGESPNRQEGLKRLREALRDAERATALNPLSSLAWETLGDIHIELSDFRNARAAWGYARGRDPDNPELYDKIGSSHWQLAFQARGGADHDELEQAAEYFDKALLLYGSGSFDEQVRAHYRLGKLYTALGRFSDALSHLKIVEAADEPPIVGWQLLGQAHLARRTFAECEYYFGRVIARGKTLADREAPADSIVGDRLDEREWPLALIRGWGHLGMALSYAERDGDLGRAYDYVRDARRLASELPDPEPFPTRIFAACDDCEGYVLFKQGDVGSAIDKLEAAVGGYPYSRSYLNLALAYEERARQDAEHRDRDLRAARRFVTHALNLRPGNAPTPEIEQVLDRLNGDAAT